MTFVEAVDHLPTLFLERALRGQQVSGSRSMIAGPPGMFILLNPAYIIAPLVKTPNTTQKPVFFFPTMLSTSSRTRHSLSFQICKEDR